MVSQRRSDQPEPKRTRPATTPEARENQLISLAVDLVEKKLRDGTASSQEVTHFLKMGSRRERLEQERLEHENELLQAKKDLMESQKRIEDTYARALDAMRAYSGGQPLELETDDEY